MNENIRPKQLHQAGPKASGRVAGRDREFLPAAIEILETPAAPGRVALMLVLCSLCVIALVWSAVGHLDIHAVAQGKIITDGYSKVVQPYEQGKVLALNVKNGAKVKAGDLLVELDPVDAATDVKAYTDIATATLGEIARRQAAVATAAAFPIRPLLPAFKIQFSDGLDDATRIREQAVLTADIQQLADQIGNLDLQIGQKIATRKRLNMSIAFQNELIQTLQDRVSMRSESFKLSVGTKVNLFDALESLDKSRSALASDKGQLIETEAGIQELASRKATALSDFIASNTTKLAEAEKRNLENNPRLAKATNRLERTKLFAPIDGTVQQLTITTLGQVVTPGQQLLVLVPSSGTLQVEAYISNTDIGFIRLGQKAAIKIDAFPFTRYGTIEATVSAIATEAIDEQEARRREANIVSAATGSSGPAGSGQQQAFVFPVTLSLSTPSIVIDGNSIPLTPGMTVTAEIRTESRRVIDYVLSPIRKTTSESLHER